MPELSKLSFVTPRSSDTASSPLKTGLHTLASSRLPARIDVVLVNCQPIFLLSLASERGEKNLKCLDGILEASGVRRNELQSCPCVLVCRASAPSRSLHQRKNFHLQIFRLLYCHYHRPDNPEPNSLITLYNLLGIQKPSSSQGAVSPLHHVGSPCGPRIFGTWSSCFSFLTLFLLRIREQRSCHETAKLRTFTRAHVQHLRGLSPFWTPKTAIRSFVSMLMKCCVVTEGGFQMQGCAQQNVPLFRGTFRL